MYELLYWERVNIKSIHSILHPRMDILNEKNVKDYTEFIY
jgi:hypothetical protein